MAFVRLAPLDIGRFHLDPETADRPKPRGQFLVREGGDAEPVTVDLPRAALAAQLDAVILATPRTTRLAGNLEEGYASYVTRSGLWGFPDVASVKIVEDAGGGAAVLILSRQVYGIEDFGVNRARVEGWLAQITP